MISEEEFILQTGLNPERFQDIMTLGWVEISKDQDDHLLFSDTDIYRVRKMLRICADFDLPVIGGTIIVDLLERIALLEQTVAELKANQGL
ncbi:MAG: MerR family transcriptional regulator [Desulfovibrio sp.]|nr:MerR family transcriptional regulator [Desulfovibrio sp.]